MPLPTALDNVLHCDALNSAAHGVDDRAAANTMIGRVRMVEK